MKLTLESLSDWLRRYFQAWVTNDPVEVAALFSQDAVCSYGPFREPARGRQQIVERWVSDPERQREVHASYQALAVSGSLGVAHWNVTFRGGDEEGRRHELDGVLLLDFTARLECSEHREWYAHREFEGTAGAPGL